MGVFNSLSKERKTSQGKSGGLFNQINSTKDEDKQRKYVEGMKNSRLMEVDTLKTKQAEVKATKDTMKTLGIDAKQKEKDDKKAADRQKLLDSRADTRKDLPLGAKKLLSGIDKFSDFVKPATDIAESFYTPAAGLTAINGLTKGAAFGVSKLFPKLAGSIGGRATQTALTEGIVGAPLGLANTLAQNPEASNRELLLNTALGAGGSTVLGGAGRLIGEGIQAGLRKGTQSLLAPTLDNSANMAKAINDVSGENLPQTVRRTTSRDAVPEVFPERFRRTVGETAEAPPSPIAEVPTQQLDANTGRIVSEPSPLRTTINERGNISTQRAGNLSDEFNQGLDARDNTYERITNIESVAKANDNVKNLSDAEATFLGNKEFSAEHVATGYRLLQELDRMGETKRALNISEKLAADLTSAGQTAQAASILKRLSPEGQLLHLQRVASSAGKEIAEADAKLYTDLARDVQAGSTTGKETSDFLDVLGKLKSGQEVTPDEMLKATAILEDAKKFIKSGRQSPERLPKEMKDVRTRDKVVSFLDEAEQSALARIKARRGQLNSLPLGEWADHAIVASSQIAKGTIRAATYVEDMVRLFGEEVRPYAKAIYTEARKLLNGSSKNISEGNVKEASEAFERLRNSQTPAGKVAEKFIKESEIMPGDVEKLRDLAKQLNDLKGKSAQEADMQMQAILNKYQKASNWDRLQAIRYISMLFNSSTQAVNALSGPIMATTGYAADVVGVLIDSVFRKSIKNPRTVTLYGSNPLRFTARWFKNAVVGAKAGARGVNPSGIAGANDIRGLTFKSLYNPLGLLERGLGAVAKGADYATYRSVYQSELDKIAYLDAKKNGIKGRKEIRDHMDKYLLNPPAEAIEQADRIGKNTTFQRSDSLGGKAANYLNSSPGPIKPVVGAIFPFVRTPINIAATALDLTPGGIIKGLYQLSSKSDASRREAIRTLGLGITGTAGISSLGYYLNQVGIITGANDSGDKDVDAVREQAGMGKYRFNTSGMKRYLDAMISGKGFEDAEKAAKYQEGDKQFDYNKLQPLAFPLAVGAGLQENEGKGLGDQLLGTAADAFGSLFGMSTLKGVQDVFQPSYSGSQGQKALGVPTRLAESFLKSFSPSALAQEARRRDPIQREVAYNDGIIKDVKQYFQSRTPGQSQKLPPRITNLGDTKTNAPGITGQFLNPYKSETVAYNSAAKFIADLIERTGDKSLAPSAIGKTVKGKNAKGEQVTLDIPQERYTKLEQQVGQAITKMIGKIPDNFTDDQKAYVVTKIYDFVKGLAREQVKKELGIIVD